MSKAKQRRLQKDIDRLWSTGRYWDWLALLEKENLVSSYVPQWQEAWKILVRRALRLPQNLPDFCNRLGSIQKIPAMPDVKFIQLLEKFVAGNNVQEEAAGFTKLSSPAAALQQKVLSWQAKLFPEKKIRKILDFFVTQPEKVTPKYFNDLAVGVQEPAWDKPLAVLGGHISYFRRLNSSSSIKSGNISINYRKLINIDYEMGTVAAAFPPALQQIVLYPFLYQIAQVWQRLSAQEDISSMAQISSTLPFLFPLVAGDKTQEIRNQLLPFDSDAYPEEALISSAPLGNNAALEEKLAWLGRARLFLAGGDPDDILFDEDEDPEESLFDTVRRIYLEVFAGLKTRRAQLSRRDQQELAQIFDPVLFKDFHYVADYPDKLIGLLRHVAESGCLGTRMALLSLIVAEGIRDRNLKKMAGEVLKDLPYPGDPIIIQVIKGFHPVIFPAIGNLKPILELYGSELRLIARITIYLIRKIESLFLVITLGKSDDLFEDMLDFDDIAEKKEWINILKEESANFIDYAPFQLIRDYLQSYPQGRYNSKNHLAFFEKTYQRHHNLDFFIGQLPTVLISTRPKNPATPDFFMMTFAQLALTDQVEALITFLNNRWDDLEKTKLENLAMLVQNLCQEQYLDARAANFFLKLAKLLERRFRAGELEANALQEKIMQIILRYRDRDKLPKSRRKRK